VNTGSTPTFVRGTATSVIDVSFFRGLDVTGWQVLEADSLSDHAYVTFSANREQLARAGRPPPNEPLCRYFGNGRPETTTGPPGTDKALAAARSLDRYLVGACEALMPRRRPGPPKKRPVYGWTAEIGELRRSCLKLRRAYQSRLKNAGQSGAQAARTEYTAAKSNLRRKIGKAKAKCWSDLCDQVDADPWGRPFKLVMRKLGTRIPGAASRGREDEIVDHLFPSVAVNNMFDRFDPARDPLELTTTIPRFTTDELTKAARRLSPGKAPGPSGIPNEILKAFVATSPSSALRVYNDCLQALTIPPCWDRARNDPEASHHSL